MLAIELWPFVGSDHRQTAGAFFDLLKPLDYLMGQSASIGLDQKHLSVVVVDDINIRKVLAIT